MDPWFLGGWMDAESYVRELYPDALIRAISSASDHVFRIQVQGEAPSIFKLYANGARQRREQHALEALKGIEGVPELLESGAVGETGWIRTSDGGSWNLKLLPENVDAAARAGGVLRRVHESPGAALSNLAGGITAEWVGAHYIATFQRLNRYRARIGMAASTLQRALQAPPPAGTEPRPSHTKPAPHRFLVATNGRVSLVDWGWATIAPPEWDLSMAVWLLSSEAGATASDAFLDGYGGTIEDQQLSSWVAYHAANQMMEGLDDDTSHGVDVKGLVAVIDAAVPV